MRWAAIFFALVAIAAAGWYFKQQTESQTGTRTEEGRVLPAGALATVKLPSSLTEQEQIGASAYDVRVSHDGGH